jgi:branched-chain amino acid transport system permease protein
MRKYLLPSLLLAILLVMPSFIDGSYWRYLGIIVFIYSIVTIGLNILAGFGGQFSLGHAALMAIGAYTTSLLTKSLAAYPFFASTGLHVWLGIAAGTLLAAVFGAFLALPALRVKGPYLAMVTVAFGWVVFKILQEWTSVTGGDLGLASIPKAQIGSFQFQTDHFYYLALVCLVLAMILQKRIVESSFGLRLRAMKFSEIGVSSVGIDVYRLKVVVFVASAAFAGFGGTLFAHQQNYVSPDNFQFFSSVFFLLAVLFGGAGTFYGPVLGALVLTLLPEMLHDFDKFRLIVYGGIILITLYFLPKGILGIFNFSISDDTKENDLETMRSSENFTPFDIANGCSLKLENISKAFGGLKALTNVNMMVPRGSIHALIGPNGAGKTTLINVITGFYRADKGRLLVDGEEAKFNSLHSAACGGVARTFQTIKLFGNMTVLEHVMVGFARHSQSGIWDAIIRNKKTLNEYDLNEKKAAELIKFVGLSGFENRNADQLAYGHRRLLEIARALAVQPKLLLLDEPAAGLVAEEIEALADVIRRLKNTGMTILLVEHHMDLVVGVSDAVTVIDYGEVIAEGTPAEVQRNERVIKAYLGQNYAAA